MSASHDPATPSLPLRSTFVAGSVLFLATFVYFLFSATDLTDDHFMHVAWGRQVLKGRLFVRDMAVLGMPLQSVLSAAAEWLIGYRLLSTAVVFSSAFATAAVVTFALAQRASGSIWIGLTAAVIQVVAAPPSYSYPKLLVYAVGIALLWRYIDQPSRRRLSLIGVAVAVAFYLRHDHGLYLGIIAVAAVMLRHWADWRLAAQRIALVSALSGALVAPYIVYIQVQWGVGAYLDDLRSFASREYHQNRFEQWPSWPLTSFPGVMRWTPSAAGAKIGIRWAPGSDDDSRREAVRRYGLIPVGDDPLDSGSFFLANTAPEHALALVQDPVIEDTSGIDRGTGVVRIAGLRLGPLHLLSGLDSETDAAAFLFYIVIGSVAISLVLLFRRDAAGHDPDRRERTRIVVVIVVAAVTAYGFIREPLAARVADALVAPLILVAWWVGLANAPALRRTIPVGVAQVAVVLLLAATVRAATVIGGLSPFVDKAADWSSAVRQLVASPPFDGWTAVGSARYRLVQYVRACTPPMEPLLVLWFAPDLYYYADRPFGGRLGFYLEGYWTSSRNERQNLEALRRDRPVLAILEDGREKTDLYTYPVLLGHLERRYRQIGELRTADQRVFRVLARHDRSPVSIDPESGWPCYAERPAGDAHAD